MTSGLDAKYILSSLEENGLHIKDNRVKLSFDNSFGGSRSKTFINVYCKFDGRASSFMSVSEP